MAAHAVPADFSILAAGKRVPALLRLIRALTPAPTLARNLLVMRNARKSGAANR
jgi:hypothetical protein